MKDICNMGLHEVAAERSLLTKEPDVCTRAHTYTHTHAHICACKHSSKNWHTRHKQTPARMCILAHTHAREKAAARAS